MYPYRRVRVAASPRECVPGSCLWARVGDSVLCAAEQCPLVMLVHDQVLTRPLVLHTWIASSFWILFSSKSVSMVSAGMFNSVIRLKLMFV